MALFSGYTGWLNGIRDFIGADDYSDTQIAIFLGLAQIKMNRELASVPMERTAPVTALASSPHPLPLDFGKIRQVSVAGVGTYDVQTKADYVNAQAQGDESQRFYALDMPGLWLWPEPGVNTVITVDYYLEVPPLSDTVDSNVFTDFHADILLYASCLEAAAYMVEDERIGVWQAKYEQGVAMANEVHKRIKQGSTPLMRKIA
jgi:hypothetical protein